MLDHQSLLPARHREHDRAKAPGKLDVLFNVETLEPTHLPIRWRRLYQWPDHKSRNRLRVDLLRLN